MSDQPLHPIRGCEIRVYIEEGQQNAVAFFDDGRSFPIHFPGSTAEAARQKAETFRQDVIAKHEQAYIARKLAAEARRNKKVKP